MLKEIDQIQARFVGGGNYTNDYCNYNGFTGNGVLFGFTMFASVAFLGLFGTCCIANYDCCYRGWTTGTDVQNGIDNGGGCCGGYFGRIFLDKAAAYTLWFCSMFGMMVITAGAWAAGAVGGGWNNNVWNCTSTPTPSPTPWY